MNRTNGSPALRLMLGAVSSLLIAALLVVSIAASADASSKRKKKEKEPEQAEVAPRFPLNLVVSTADQKVYVYHGTELLESSPVSTGQRAFPTPTGVFSILAKSRHHYSNLYGGAPMPWTRCGMRSRPRAVVPWPSPLT